MASQRNSQDLLDSMQFCNNLHRSSATNLYPLELATGQRPLISQKVVKQRSQGRCQVACSFVEDKQEPIGQAQNNLVNLVRQIKKYVD